jgi:hypothetical protein
VAREIDSSYRDVLELIWLRAAAEIGYAVVRSDEVYASFDGESTLEITRAAHFDPDDCLGQMLFHELCHALVAGPEGRKRKDWGLENTDKRDAVLEQATNRLQAALTLPHGLRFVFGTTTDFRDYYDALPEDPLAGDDDPAIAVARRALDEAQTEPWHGALQRALARTATIAAIASEVAEDGSLWRKYVRRA